MRDLQWWARLSTNPDVGRRIWQQPEATLFTDASLRGWGAAWNGEVPAAAFFTASEEGSSINELELTAALSALRHFILFAKKRQVELVTDSKVTSHIVRNITGRSPRLLEKQRALRHLCEEHGVCLSTRHFPSVLNCWADSLSRRQDQHAWTLPEVALSLLERRFGRPLHTLDGHGLPDARPLPPSPVVIPRPSLIGILARHLADAGFFSRPIGTLNPGSMPPPQPALPPRNTWSTPSLLLGGSVFSTSTTPRNCRRTLARPKEGGRAGVSGFGAGRRARGVPARSHTSFIH